ncbi:nitroreductase family protein [Fundidesulfovibrio terrae]|uniref:nitroreductase family protein n=1 Tax=Fundidesulfovibrio terrae TaxID=2922866 RepID=UPI001FAEA873|nr:nitroreductase family protein [Fundidesulfovibrio terrae]
MSIKRRTVLGLAAALPVLATGTAFAQQAKGMDALECIQTRRSMRKYLDKPVSDDLIKQVLEAAMLAPSAHNEQPWHFVVVKNRDKLKAFTQAGSKPAEGAAAGILVCGEPGIAKAQGTWPLDCSAATQNLLLAANALGLGGVWTVAYPDEDRMAKYRTLLSIPQTIMPFAFVCLGWPEKPGWKETTRIKPERIKQETWS